MLLAVLCSPSFGVETNKVVVVRHAPSINSGLVEGSVQQLTAESVALNGGVKVTGNLLVPGTPAVTVQGSPVFGGIFTGSGAAQPTNYKVTIKGNTVLGSLVTRIDPEALASVLPVPAPAGTRDLTISSPGESIGDAATLRNLTLNGSAGQVAIPPGTYGNFSAGGGAGFILGSAGGSTSSVYNLQNLTLNAGAKIEVAGPVILTVANGLAANGMIGAANDPAMLQLRIKEGGVTLNGGSAIYGQLLAPAGTVTVNGGGLLIGSVECDRFVLNGSGIVRWGGSVAANQAPLVNAGLDQTVILLGSAMLSGNVSDDGLPAGSALSVQWSRISGAGTVAFGNSNSLSTTATFSAAGTNVLRLTASDGALSGSDDLTIVVVQPNRAPSADAQAVATDENVPIPIQLSGSDPDNDLLSFRITELPAHGTLATNNLPQVVYTPETNYNGADHFAFVVNDGVVDSAPASVVITVNPVDDAPIADGQSVGVLEDQSITITLTGSDPEGDPLTFQVTQSPAHGVLNTNSLPLVTYIPETNYFGPDSFRFVANDGTTNSGAALVAISVGAVNDPPSFVKGADRVAMEDAGSQTVTNWASIISAGPANEGGQIVHFVVSNDNAAIFAVQPSVSADGALTYSTAANANGAANVSLFLMDDGGVASGGVDASAAQAFTITVIAVNDAPVLSGPAALVVAEDSPLPLSGTNAIAVSDIDAGGQPLKITVAAQHGTVTLGSTAGLELVSGANGSASLSVSGSQAALNAALETLSYLGSTNYTGTDELTVTVDDQGNSGSGGALVDSRLVIVTVSPVNDPPVANSQSVTNSEDAAVSITLTGLDVDGDSLTFSIVSGPVHGVLSGTPPNVAYLPNTNFHGLDEFRFVVNDGTINSAEAVMSLTILAVNDAPVVFAGPDLTNNFGTTFTLNGSASDDGDPSGQLSVVWNKVSGPGTVSFENGASAVTTATFSAPGIYLLRLRASDTELEGSDDVMIAVNAAPQVSAGNDQLLGATNGLPEVLLTGFVTDDSLPVPGTVTVSWSKLSGPGSVTFGNSAATNSTATFSQSGVYILRLTATDGLATSSDDVVISLNVGPTVYAGYDLELAMPLGGSVTNTLNGSVTDDGAPFGAALIIGWSKVSGPGTVLFGTGTNPVTTARFNAAGTYILRLAASDSQYFATDDVTVHVTLTGTNTAPIVTAGPDISIGLTNQTTLAGCASDDGLPEGSLISSWSKVSGPAEVTFANTNQTNTLATFGASGSYILRLTASDGQLTSTDEVVVTVYLDNLPPIVNAGADQTITLPNTTLPVSHTVSLPASSSYSWQPEVGAQGLTDPVNTQWVNRNGLAAREGVVYATGQFRYHAGIFDNGFALWDGCSWGTLDDPDIPGADYATGARVEVYGTNQVIFSGLVDIGHDGHTPDYGIWNGAHWIPLAVPTVNLSTTGEGDIVAHGQDIYIAGDLGFRTNKNDLNAPIVYGIIKWDGTNWISLDRGILDVTQDTNSVDSVVDVMSVVVAENGDIFVGGHFTMDTPNGQAKNIARWNGTNWLALGSGISGCSLAGNCASIVNGVTIGPDGNLYVCGNFNTAGGVSANNIARWDGTNWFPLGIGLGSDAHAILRHRNDIYVGGNFTTAGGITANRVAKWTGTQWESLGTGAANGVNSAVFAFASSSSGVYLGGMFNIAGGQTAQHIAKWGTPEPPTLTCIDPVTAVVNSPGGAILTLSVNAGQPCGRPTDVSWSVDGDAPEQNTSITALSQAVAFTHTYPPGVHTLTITVDDHVAPAVTCTTTVTVPPAIQTTLQGNVTDDGRPPGNVVTQQWTQVSGPGTAQFANPTNTATSVVFQMPGTYVLRLTATDGEFSSSDDVEVLIRQNQPPTVDAGPDNLNASAGQPLSLTGSGTDDGLPSNSLTFTWSKVAGPGTVTFADSHATNSTVVFSIPGYYIIRLTATDGQASVSDEELVNVAPACQTTASGLAAWWTADNVLQDVIGGNVATRLNGAAFTAGRFGQAFFFDGVNDGIHLPASASLEIGSADTGITLEAWINPADISGSRPIMEWEGADPQVTGNYGVHFWTGVTAAGALFANLIDTANGAHVFNSPGNVLTAGVWQHVALTYDKDSGVGRIFVNGLLVAQSNLGHFTPKTKTHFLIGYRAAGPVMFKGAIDEPALYTRALTIEEVGYLASASTDPRKCSGGPLPTRMDVAADFSAANNPNGVWSYGYHNNNVASTSFTLFPAERSDANVDSWQTSGDVFGNSYPLVAHNKTDALQFLFSAFTIMPEEVLMHPSSVGEYAVVRWTAPASGLYRVEGFFEELYTGSTDVHIRHNNAAVYDATMVSDRTAIRKFNLTRQVGMGDTIDFKVGFGGNDYFGDATGLRATITPLSELGSNHSPSVVAGPDDALVLPANYTLVSSITDDGLPPNSSLSFIWDLVSGPGTVTASPASGATPGGQLTTTFTFSTAGTYQLRLSATDGALTNSDVITLRVYASGTANAAPVVSAGSDFLASVSTGGNLSGTVTDDGLPTGSALTINWTKVSGPGTVAFADPSAPATHATFGAVGTYTLRLTASDSLQTRSDDVVVTVNNNLAPVVNAGATFTLGQALTGNLAGYVTDDGLPNGTFSTEWSQVSGPGVATFGDAGATNSTVHFSAPGIYILRLTGDDGQTIGSADLMVTVIPGPNQAPIVNAGPDQTLNLPGVVTLNGTATDDNLPQGILESSWSKVSGPGTVTFDTLNGVYRASFSQSGTYVVRYTVSDTELSGSDDLTVTAVDYIDPPTAIILSPADGSAVTAPTVITGTVSSTILSNYQLQYRLKGAEDEDQAWIPLSTNTATVTSGPVGALDPTLLLNGIYELRLVATDTLNRTGISEMITVIVDRQMKVGHFSLSFSDLKVPVAGIPIEVVRTYDSRDKRTGDFGVGWTLGLKNIRLQKNRNLGVNWDESSSGGLLPTYFLEPRSPRVVTITFPDGKAYKFTMKVAPESQFGVPIASVQITYTNSPDMPGTLVSMESDQADLVGSVPGLVDLIDLSTGNIYNPSLFKLTTAEGDIYVIHEKEGLKSMTDRNGNTLTITPEGIIHSSGKSITFVRDAEGRIGQITDPAGNSMRYLYTTNGDLAQYIDRVSNTNSYTYDAAHRLLTVVDPRGIQPLRNEFDDSGRLARQIDSNSRTNYFQHDLSNHREFITDRLGFTTIHEYDDNGNVIRTTDPLNNVTTYTFDANDNQLSKTDALTNTTRFAYDSNNNKIEEVDSLGFTNRWTYDASRNVLTMTDGRGFTRTNVYDSGGNLTRQVDNLGQITELTYDLAGNVLTRTDPLGNVTEYAYENFTHQTNVIVRDARFGVLNSTSYKYDVKGNKTNQTTFRTTPSGLETLVTSFVYDSEDRLVLTIHPDGSTAQTIYNEIGKPALEIDALGRQTVHQYDGQGNLTRTTHPDLTFEVFGFDAENRKLFVQDRGGRTTIYTNDALGRVLTAVFPDGATTNAVYDAVGRLVLGLDERGNPTRFDYDPNCGCSERTARITDALNHETHFNYDGNGNEEVVTDPLGFPTQYFYDAENRQTRTLFVDGTHKDTVFDTLGRRVTEIDQSGRATWFDYDALNRLIAVTNALGQITRYGYDEVGNLVSQLNANSHLTTFTYDSMRRRTTRTLPEGQMERFFYDVAGNVTNRIDFNARETRFSHDADNRLLQKLPDSFFGQPPVVFTYTATGKRATMSDASGITVYQYNSRDWLTNKITPQGALAYTRDSHGNLLSIHSSNTNGVSITYQWDSLNRLSTATEANLGQTTYEYDPTGNLTAYTYPNGLRTTRSFDRLHRLTNIFTATAPNAPVRGYGYSLAATGRRTAVSELSGRTVAYEYHASYKLTRETVVGLSGHPSGTVDYTHDSVGNRLSRVSTQSGVSSTTATYDANDRISSDTYDANGNTILGKIDPAGASVADQYDFEDRLIARPEAQVQIVYDGDGNRVSETVAGITTLYLVDEENPTGYSQVLEEIRDVSGTSAAFRTYVYGSDLIAQDQLITNVWIASFYGYDGHGSVRYLTSISGNITATYDYDAFGALIGLTGTTPNTHLSCGESSDSDLGLYYYRTRYLNVHSGRFWSRDLFEGAKYDPSSLHKYLYAQADPVNNIDPSGELSLSEIMSGIGIDGQMQRTVNLLVGEARRIATRTVGCEVAKAAAVQGVYIIVLGNGQLYVGQSKDIGRRFAEHLRDLEKAGARIAGMLEITTGIQNARAAKYLREIFEALLIKELNPGANVIKNPIATASRFTKYLDPVQAGMDKLFKLTPICK